MKRLSRISAVCLFSAVLAGCQSTPLQDLQSGLNALDLNLNSGSYVVRAGETLETIAFRYNTSVEKLVRLNPNAAQGVYSGMHLALRDRPNRSMQTSTEVARADIPAVAPIRQSTLVGRTSPTQINQATPLPRVARDTELLAPTAPRQSVNQNSAPAQIAVPQIVRAPSTGYVEQPGYPVEEVIDDENFTLPTSSASANTQVQQAVSSWDWPMAGQLAREYDPLRPNGRGIEIVGLPGQPVYAARDGIVDLVARSPDGIGKVVIVRHADDYLSVYSNTNDLFVSVQDTVRQGDPIASLGANSNDEPLLRFEISKDGKLLNPMDYLTPM